MGWTRALWLFKYLNGWEVAEKKCWHPCNALGSGQRGRGMGAGAVVLQGHSSERPHSPRHCCSGSRQIPSCTQTPAEGEERKNNTPRQAVLSKPLCFPSGRGTTAAPASATASPAQPGAGHSISEAVPQLSQLHRQLIPPRTAEQSSLMPIKQSVLSTCKVWGGGGAVLLFQGNVLRQLHRERHPGPAKWHC